MAPNRQCRHQAQRTDARIVRAVLLCMLSVARIHAECMPGWAGDDCDEVICPGPFCAEHLDDADDGTPQCALGWSGNDCDIPPAAPPPEAATRVQRGSFTAPNASLPLCWRSVAEKGPLTLRRFGLDDRHTVQIALDIGAEGISAPTMLSSLRATFESHCTRSSDGRSALFPRLGRPLTEVRFVITNAARAFDSSAALP